MTRTNFLAGLAALLAAPLLSAPLAAQDKPGTAAAPFLLLGTDARGLGMGSANVATAQGAAALHWNPAGISDGAGVASGDVVLSTSEWIVGSRHNFAGATLRAAGGTLGLSVTQLDYGEEPVTTIANPDGTGELYGAADLAVGVSYARALTERFTIGGTAKVVQQRIWNESATGGAFDLGLLYRTDFRGLTIGMAMTNFGTDMRLAGRDLRVRVDPAPGQGGNNDDIPANLEVSAWSLPLSFNVGVSAEAYRANDLALTVSAVGQAPSDNSQSASFGGEASFRDLFFVRGGYRQAFSSVAEDGGWAVGAGLNLRVNDQLGLRVDYVVQEIQPFGTPQMFSFGLTF